MFDRVNVKAGIDEENKACTIYVNWSWVFGQTATEAPTCKVFCCGVEQEQLLKNFLFRKQEILDWFDKNVVNFTSPDYDNIFKLYHQNPSHLGNSYYNTVSFHNGDAINRQQPMRFPYEAKTKIFLVCVYDGEKFVSDVVAAKSTDVIGFNISQPKKLFGLFGDSTPTLNGIGGDDRQKVLIINDGGKTTYSMIPKNYSEYYISDKVAKYGADKISVKYITDFI